jgi:hypothetical protein
MVSAGLAGLTLALATPVSFHASRTYTVTGSVEHFDEAKSVLILQPDGAKTSARYAIDVSGTRVKRNGVDIMLEALRAGQRVTLELRETRNHTVTVNVFLLGPPATDPTR